MRTRTVLVLGVLLAATVTGCAKNSESPGVATAASGNPRSTAGPTASAGIDPDAPLKHAKCMRENGMSWFPDPQGPNSTIRIPSNVAPEDFQKAMQACRQWAPDGGEKPEADPARIEMARQMARCMRENGVPGFPDPNPDGSLHLDGEKIGTGPGDPTFDKAEEKCSQYRPSGAVQRHVGGPGTAGGGA
ncbi:hypothetical protein QLQ12_25615 [Actinoplanes sp. NEAU-A12]|uniref:Lipoprotein n=1 Tax=Actinoplanes sandaracinus TaxID=3045177 RepID=A0ABT6WQI2_9ACTN|nr:hypothetical protein [Actinoplanes sandaracinus]MDI6102002.1 hypothetical protein [Actinoplanes sandaracinus]